MITEYMMKNLPIILIMVTALAVACLLAGTPQAMLQGDGTLAIDSWGQWNYGTSYRRVPCELCGEAISVQE